MGIRTVDLLLVTIVMVSAATSVLGMDLVNLLRSRQRQRYGDLAQKRAMIDGNPCPTPEKPFPCKSSATCIPMVYVCDDNFDCEDGYDEDTEVCTAVTEPDGRTAHRPPVEAITHFLESEKNWLIPNIFGDKSITKIAHGLAVSQTVDDFRRRVGMSNGEVRNLRGALKAVRSGSEELMEQYGMPTNAWDEVMFFFSKLVKSGFDG